MWHLLEMQFHKMPTVEGHDNPLLRCRKLEYRIVWNSLSSFTTLSSRQYVMSETAQLEDESKRDILVGIQLHAASLAAMSLSI